MSKYSLKGAIDLNIEKFWNVLIPCKLLSCCFLCVYIPAQFQLPKLLCPFTVSSICGERLLTCVTAAATVLYGTMVL